MLYGTGRLIAMARYCKTLLQSVHAASAAQAGRADHPNRCSCGHPTRPKSARACAVLEKAACCGGKGPRHYHICMHAGICQLASAVLGCHGGGAWPGIALHRIALLGSLRRRYPLPSHPVTRRCQKRTHAPSLLRCHLRTVRCTACWLAWPCACARPRPSVQSSACGEPYRHSLAGAPST